MKTIEHQFRQIIQRELNRFNITCAELDQIDRFTSELQEQILSNAYNLLDRNIISLSQTEELQNKIQKAKETIGEADLMRSFYLKVVHVLACNLSEETLGTLTYATLTIELNPNPMINRSILLIKYNDGRSNQLTSDRYALEEICQEVYRLANIGEIYVTSSSVSFHCWKHYGDRWVVELDS